VNNSTPHRGTETCGVDDWAKECMTKHIGIESTSMKINQRTVAGVESRLGGSENKGMRDQENDQTPGTARTLWLVKKEKDILLLGQAMQKCGKADMCKAYSAQVLPGNMAIME